MTEKTVGPVSTTGQARAVLDIRDLSKTFAGTRALRNVSLTIERGEVHALVGQNGSGKSTLIKVLAGFHTPDEGSTAFLNGERFGLGDAHAAGSERIRFVHQDLGLILELSAMDNFALTSGFETGFGGRIKWRDQAREAASTVAALGIELDVTRPLTQATPVERTIVAIAAAISGWEPEGGLLVLDEPTAVLPHTEVDRLLGIVENLRDRGASVLYVSHRLDEIFRIADRVTVLRDGTRTDTEPVSTLNSQKLAELMVGDNVDAAYRLKRSFDETADPALQVQGLSGYVLQDFDFDVKPGEILGVAGFAGSGAGELPYLLSGIQKPSDDKAKVRAASLGDRWMPASALGELKIPLVPADRAGQGVIADFGVRENLTLSIIDSVRRGPAISRNAEYGTAVDWMQRLQVKASSPDASIMSLSGGNQQKVVIGKCLASKPDLLILAEPTAGVDVGTRQAIYELIGSLADQGLAVVVTSTDTGDILALASRVLVLNRGVVTARISADDLTEQSLLNAMEAEV